MQFIKAAGMMLVIGLLSTTVWATDSENKISTKDLDGESRNSLVRIFKAKANQKITIRIREMRGYTIIHREEVFGTRTLMFNFSKLEEGKYVIETITEGKKTKETFTVEKEEEKSLTYFHPTVRVNDDRVDVLFKNPTSAKMTMLMYDKNGRALLKKEVEANQEFANTLNVSKLKRGTYTLSMVGKGCSYTKHIDIR